MGVNMLGFGRRSVFCLVTQLLFLTFVLGIPPTKNQNGQAIQAKPRDDQYEGPDYSGEEASDDEYDEPQNDGTDDGGNDDGGNDDDGNDDGAYDYTDENLSHSDPSEYNDPSSYDSYQPHTSDNGTNPNQPSTNESIPDHLDWRELGYVTEVENQGLKNCCWAFAITEVVEGLHKKKTGQLVRLSVQNLVDCGSTVDLYQDFNYTMNYGLEAESSYKWTGQMGAECKYDENKVVAKISAFHLLPKGDEEVMKRVVAVHGPIYVSIDFLHSELISFSKYKSGIYTGPCSSIQNYWTHAVVIVGYGTEEGQDYWLLKNSWGKGWGEQGYFKLPRNKNACGIGQGPIYVT